MTQRSAVAASFSVKYRWPEPGRERLGDLALDPEILQAVIALQGLADITGKIGDRPDFRRAEQGKIHRASLRHAKMAVNSLGIIILHIEAP